MPSKRCLGTANLVLYSFAGFEVRVPQLRLLMVAVLAREPLAKVHELAGSAVETCKLGSNELSLSFSSPLLSCVPLSLSFAFFRLSPFAPSSCQAALLTGAVFCGRGLTRFLGSPDFSREPSLHLSQFLLEQKRGHLYARSELRRCRVEK